MMFFVVVFCFCLSDHQETQHILNFMLTSEILNIIYEMKSQSLTVDKDVLYLLLASE
jgi:hypothetical protein